MLLSIVVPLYNESEGLNHFHDKLLLPEVKKVSKSYEIIYINDGSKDDTLNILRKIADRDKKVKVVNLSRNFGKELATTAGIHESNGDVTIVLDGDGQHPPKLISSFIDRWLSGSQVVIGVRKSNKNEGIVKKYGSRLFYKLFNSTSGIELIPGSTDYRLIDRVVRDEFIKFTEHHRITRGLIDWLGFKRDYIYFDASERYAGEASYKTGQLFKLAINSFVSLSFKPLFIIGWLGAVITILSFLLGVFIFLEQFVMADPLNLYFSGSAMLGVFVSFLVGLLMVSQAIIAVYISHIHTQTKNRPLFVIDPTSSIGIKSN